MSLEFLIVSVVLALMPGTGVLFAISCGLSQGRSGAVWGAVAGAVGVIPHLIAAGLGLSALLVAHPQVYGGLRIAGGLYLLYLAGRSWAASRAMPEAQAVTASGLRIVLQGALINLLNPKLTLFFVALLPQFIPAEAAGSHGLIIAMGGVLVAETFAVFLIYGLLAAGLHHRLSDNPRIFQLCNESIAVLFAGLGIRVLAGSR
ncbi:LysE family translocator [Poseidonocella sedimentorum]|uniref:Threonine/homoserine/homoserine lactone efflux protein n=1 Tax=Poseidonocella sedimentorum TaxID=871652 RepID=A0A1I6CTG4_9RHOB|nr:LysE family translocator [Poseidonocella sedimentorum]SFQ96411.1 Threonine/homoserine/homoserine lactone efflux protein [Poseidonocella sedimentorum]